MNINFIVDDWHPRMFKHEYRWLWEYSDRNFNASTAMRIIHMQTCHHLHPENCHALGKICTCFQIKDDQDQEVIV